MRIPIGSRVQSSHPEDDPIPGTVRAITAEGEPLVRWDYRPGALVPCPASALVQLGDRPITEDDRDRAERRALHLGDLAEQHLDDEITEAGRLANDRRYARRED